MTTYEKLRQLEAMQQYVLVCTFCDVPTTLRNLTNCGNGIGACPACCEILEIPSIADWPTTMMWCRWDYSPWRPQDYR